MNAQNSFPNQEKNLRPTILVMLVIILAIILGASFLVISSPFAPLVILAGVIGIYLLFMCMRKPVWAIYFTIFVLLLPSGLIPAVITSLFNRVATVLAFIVWIFFFIGKRPRLVLTLSTGFMFCFLIWSAISLSWASNQAEGIVAIQTYALRLIFFLLLLSNEIRTKPNLERLMNVIALSGVLLEVISVAYIILQGYVPGSRLQVLQVNENELGIDLLIALPGVLWWASRPSKRFTHLKKYLAALFLLVAIALTGLSGSRGSAISLGITILAFMIWKSTRRWGILSLATIGVALIVLPFVFSTTLERFLGSPSDPLLGGREYIWPAAWQLIKEHFLIGVGIGNSSIRVIPYMINNGAPWVSLVSEPLHNPLMVIWADTGIVGLIFYLGVLVSASALFLIDYFWSRKKGLSDLLPYYELVFAMFAGYMVSWIKGGGIESGFTYFLVLSLLIAPTVLKKSSFHEMQTNDNI